MFGPEKPQTKILRRVIHYREMQSMTQRQVAERLDASPLYGEYSEGSYANLERTDFEGPKPRTVFNRQLIKALASVLGVQVSDLATEDELSALRDMPYRRAQWPRAVRERHGEDNQTRDTVTSPGMTAKRAYAYMQQHGYTYRDFAERLDECGYHITPKQLVRSIGPDRSQQMSYRHITDGFCDAAVKVFRGRMNRGTFELEWLLQCHGLCPHCKPFLINS